MNELYAYAATTSSATVSSTTSTSTVINVIPDQNNLVWLWIAGVIIFVGFVALIYRKKHSRDLPESDLERENSHLDEGGGND